MCSHQISRTSQISDFRIKYEVGISFKRTISEKLDKKKMDAEDELLMMRYLLMRKRRSQQRKQWSEKPFVVIRCHSLYHSLSLDVPLVLLFINDPFATVLSSSKFTKFYLLIHFR